MNNRNSRRLLGLPYWISNRLWINPGRGRCYLYPIVMRVSKGARKRLALYGHK